MKIAETIHDAFPHVRDTINAFHRALCIVNCALFIFIFCSCSSGTKSNSDDDATSGSIKIAADEEYQPLINTEVDTFMKLYRYSKITAAYKSETAAFKDLVSDSVRLVVASRQLNDEEK